MEVLLPLCKRVYCTLTCWSTSAVVWCGCGRHRAVAGVQRVMVVAGVGAPCRWHEPATFWCSRYRQTKENSNDQLLARIQSDMRNGEFKRPTPWQEYNRIWVLLNKGYLNVKKNYSRQHMWIQISYILGNSRHTKYKRKAWWIHKCKRQIYKIIVGTFGWQNFCWNWLKNTVLAELLWEKNTVPAEKRSRTSHF